MVEISYDKYRKHIEKIAYIKESYINMRNKRKESYINYVKYKDLMKEEYNKYKEFKEKELNLMEKVIEEIPSKWR